MEKENSHNIIIAKVKKENSLKPETKLGALSPDDEPSGCGYCKKEGKKNYNYYSFGFSSSKFTPELYEKIMFLGWRRCGDYIYRPILEKNCCKMYSIRLDANKFKINKNQKKVIRNFKQYLVGKFNKIEKKPENKSELDMEIESNLIKNTKEKKFSENLLIEIIYKFLNEITFLNFFLNELKIEEKELYDLIKDPNLVKLFPCKNKAQGEISSTFLITFSNKFKKNLINCNYEFSKFYIEIHSKFIEFLNSQMNEVEFQTNLSEKTGHVNFKFSSTEALEKYNLNLLNNSNIIDNEKKCKIVKININKEKEDSFIYSPIEHIYDEPSIYKSDVINNYTLELDLNSNITDVKFNLYKKYQMTIHKDKENELTKSRYKSSWGTSNLISDGEFDFEPLKGKLTENQIQLLPKKYGTYDLIHKINGKIIAIGILDIMPESVSSVYLYYDTDYSFLNIGVFTALKEIEYTLFLQKYLSKSIKYYVMGFYIYDCQKMKYKGEYFPSEILCPITLNFYSLDDKNVQNILNIKSNEPLSNEDEMHPNLLLDNYQIDEIIKNTEIFYNDKAYNLHFFINNMIHKIYIKTLLDSIRNFIRHYSPENFKNTKLLF